MIFSPISAFPYYTIFLDKLLAYSHLLLKDPGGLLDEKASVSFKNRRASPHYWLGKNRVTVLAPLFAAT
jgi:hypothetical protein